jgi:hypothetical protein
MGCRWQLRVTGIEALWTLLQHHKIITGQGPPIRDLKGFVYKPAKGGLGIPVVNGPAMCRAGER